MRLHPFYYSAFVDPCSVGFGVVVGQEELDSRSVNVRNRDDVGTKARTETLPLDVIVEKLSALKEVRSLHNKLQ